MTDDLKTRADLIAAAHGRHVARIAGVRRAIDDEARAMGPYPRVAVSYERTSGGTMTGPCPADPLAPVPLIDEPLYVVKPEALAARPAAIRADAASLAQEIVAAIRGGLDVMRPVYITPEWIAERANGIAAGLLGNYKIERLP